MDGNDAWVHSLDTMMYMVALGDKRISVGRNDDVKAVEMSISEMTSGKKKEKKTRNREVAIRPILLQLVSTKYGKFDRKSENEISGTRQFHVCYLKAPFRKYIYKVPQENLRSLTNKEILLKIFNRVNARRI